MPDGTQEAIVCMGTVVAARFVLTAAHCLRPAGVRYFVDNFRVLVDDVNFKGPRRRIIGARRTIEYPRYRRGSGVGEIGLIELAEPAGVRSLQLAERRFWAPGAEAEIAGWG